jgi:hypothetical protein
VKGSGYYPLFLLSLSLLFPLLLPLLLLLLLRAILLLLSERRKRKKKRRRGVLEGWRRNTCEALVTPLP